MINHNEAIQQFKNAMRDNSITPPETIIGDGSIHRFKIAGKMNGAYVLQLDGIAAGYFQDFKQGIKVRWKQAGKFMPLSEFQRQELAKKRALDDATRQAEEVAKHAEAAKKAVYIWNNAKPAAASHPYLIKKRIDTHGARLGRDNTLIIHLHNAKKELCNLQFISETGGKRFLSGGIKKGCFYCLGDPTEKILICEGFATGASLFESSSLLTVVAFDAGNLKEVAKNIKGIYPKSEIVICGDNDKSGVGQKAAIEAALAIGGKYILPATPGHDWNDSLNMEVDYVSYARKSAGSK
ncbi:MAG: toprim domain-containing protein [Methylotenera sp.]